jgi:glucose dehydrogenase
MRQSTFLPRRSRYQLPYRKGGAAAASTHLRARTDDTNWILPARTYAGNRYTALTQINKTNVGDLGQAWRTDMADDE